MQASELREVSLALRAARRNQTPIETPTKIWPALDAEGVSRMRSDLIIRTMGSFWRVHLYMKGQPSTGSSLGGTPRKPTELTLRDTRGTLRFNDREVMSGNTANILGNPLSATAWLVNRLAAYDIEFKPGQVILPGSYLQAVPMEEAGHWTCTFESWGTVEFDVV
ncbi:hypothetical protein APSETT444_010517 [Aspergillus pseudonomiae]